MKRLKRKVVFRKGLFLIGSIVCLTYLFSCLTPYINPVHFWPLTFLALVFPFLLVAMLFILVLTLFFFRSLTWVVILTIAFGYQNILSTIAFHPAQKFEFEKKSKSFRLLSWNVNDFIDSDKKNDTANSRRRQMFDFIKKTNADVLCFQDFSDYRHKYFSSSFDYIKDSLGYPYTFFAIGYTEYIWQIKHSAGVVFFSRFPITDTGRIVFDKESTDEYFTYNDVKIEGHNIRFFNAHLQSMRIHANSAAASENNPSMKADKELFSHLTTFRKLKRFDKIHVDQALFLKSFLNNSPEPFIVCADLNTVPSSYVYHHLATGLGDAFLTNGLGLGSTYDSISPTLRIDVVLFSKQLKAIQHYTPHLHLSDHYPNVTDIEIQ